MFRIWSKPYQPIPIPLAQFLAQQPSLKYECYRKVTFLIFKQTISKSLLAQLLEIFKDHGYSIAFTPQHLPDETPEETYLFVPVQIDGQKQWTQVFHHSVSQRQHLSISPTKLNRLIYQLLDNGQLFYLRIKVI